MALWASRKQWHTLQHLADLVSKLSWAIKCLGWSWLIGWLWPIAHFPLLNFYNEYVVALGLMGAMACLCWHRPRFAWPSAATVAVPLVLMGLVQLARSDLDFSTVAWVLLYLGLFIAACWVGMQLRDVPDALPLLAQAMASAALLSAVLAVVQLTPAQSLLFPWLRSLPPGLRPFANLGQPNHLSLLLMLGVASCAYLWACQRWRGCVALLAMVVLMSGLVLAHTRAAVWMALVLAALTTMHQGPQRKWLMAWGWGLVAVLLIGIVVTPALMNHWGQAWRSAPLLPGNSDARVQTWLASLTIIRLAPWSGVGLGHYSLGFFEVAPLGFGALGPTDHAHQLFLQWAVEVGVPVALCSAMVLCHWCWRQWRRPRTLSQQFALACVSMMLVHNLVEFPWWSLYFLIPTGVLAGYLEPELATTRPRRDARGALLCMLATAGSLHLAWQYRQMSTDFEAVVLIRNAQAINTKAQETPAFWPWFSPFERYMRFVSTPITRDNAAQQAAEGRWLIRRFPHPFGVMHQLQAAIEAQQWQEVEAVLRTLRVLDPKTYAKAVQALQQQCDARQKPYCTAAKSFCK